VSALTPEQLETVTTISAALASHLES
jgi:hypothetical protein